jgi:hypothetical protein
VGAMLQASLVNEVRTLKILHHTGFVLLYEMTLVYRGTPVHTNNMNPAAETKFSFYSTTTGLTYILLPLRIRARSRNIL